MRLLLENYPAQLERWPKSSRHILAQFDEESILVYQAYNSVIGRYAVEHGKFGGEFSYSRMSWIKTNFLWMMFRSGWGTKENQEITLALRLRRAFFDSLLAQAVPTTWNRDMYPAEKDWKAAGARTSVLMQWDPDHHPNGAKHERRAIQLGLRGEVLAAFGKSELIEVIDLTAFVAEQRERSASSGVSALQIPAEHVYRPADPQIAARTGLADWP